MAPSISVMPASAMPAGKRGVSARQQPGTKKPHYIIELDNVWKTYSLGEAKVHALQGLTIRIERGSFLAIMGPSGSGKSTCVNMIGCLDVPTRGTIYLEGDDISHMSESDLAQIRGKKIGFIFQQFNLINTLTAAENIALPMVFQGVPREERMDKAYQLLRLVDLGGRAGHKPTELSGGEQQRVAIARSLCNDPEVILADEPTGNLDTKTGASVIDFLRKLHREKGKTIILVSHDEHLAKKADKIAYLQDGKFVEHIHMA